MKIFFLCLLILGASCSFKKSPLENQTLKGHTELYSEPNEPKIQKLGEFQKRVVIAATNDIHGHYQTHELAFKDEHEANLQTMRMGGVDTMEAYFKILRDSYSNVVLVDSGDIFANSHSSNTVKEFYRTLRYDALTVGLSDFNLKLPQDVTSSTELFKKFSKTSPTPLLVSNLYELKTGRVVEWEGAKPYLIKDVDGVKVGIIGLIPDDIVALTPVNNRVGLFVESMLQSTLRNARLLRSLGADLIVVLTHQGIDCNTEQATASKLPLAKVNFEPKRSAACNLKGVLGEYLERLPPHLVDVVVGGRNHQKMANFVNGTLVMGGFPDGKSFNYAEFVINTKTKRIDPDATVVHQPVLFCQEFFSETKDCFTEDSSVNHKNRIPATFLGKPISFPKTSPVKETTSTSPIELKDAARGLVSFTADVVYASETAGESQLFVVSMNGKDLMKILEEDFNRGHKNQWMPSPYLVQGNELQLLIGGLDVEPVKTYRILTDLESIQSHPGLLKNISNNENQSFMNYSWASFIQDKDSINTRMAAQAR